MKKALWLLMFVSFISPIKADTCFDLVNQLIFSEPESPNINPYIYHDLYLKFSLVAENATIYGRPLIPELEKVALQLVGGNSSLSVYYCKEVIEERNRLVNYFLDYLHNIGSPEALRLIADLKKNQEQGTYLLYQNPQKYRLNNGKTMPGDFGIKYKVCKNLNKFKRPKDY